MSARPPPHNNSEDPTPPPTEAEQFHELGTLYTRRYWCPDDVEQGELYVRLLGVLTDATKLDAGACTDAIHNVCVSDEYEQLGRLLVLREVAFKLGVGQLEGEVDPVSYRLNADAIDTIDDRLRYHSDEGG